MMEQILIDIRGQFLQNAKSSYYKQLMKDYKVNQIDIPLFCQINKINRISFPIRNENCKNIQCIFQDDSIIQAYRDQKNDNCPNCSQELIKEKYFLDLSLEQLIYKYDKNQKTEYLSSDHIRIQRHGNEYEKMMVTLTINSDMNEYAINIIQRND
ncbi:hypothetical protein PPERSA_11820 [Pseudocohnilembus persalinus]|uniref:SP-RING-type domain-containing protein n=1 Tax=Pseudocohnilembus persalinus TaxID=266149 RepID=A0A0V0QRF1_PSEPJ|nr:hypothetical protein PPERSA_11820 [Pseudocohnilembus persalinus]|eukprot:KRX04764.1 hypothetical protein PPERSA_11820 [Pseudocohnilembus persalinus]